jgi:FMN-dependent oxidoreductase (nitrilotriacetate monooxygenase family)
MPRQIRFNAFDMNCVAHQSSGLWRHPDDRSQSYTDLGYWTELAKLLEKGRFDGIFLADVLGTYDVYGGTNEAAIRNGAQIPVADPLLVIPAMAYVTEHLGFGVTAGTAYEHPYPFARRMSTLDHLTKGRVGWNVVTGYLPSAARNMGNEDQLEHDDRYDYADEYLEVLYKLWEGSWEDDAVVRDAASGVFTDPSKVHSIGHSGKHFQVPGIHLSEPSPQRSPVIYQAGASSRGIAFAAGNAEAIFVAASTKEVLKGTVTKIRDALEAAGRDRHSAKIYTLLTIITDETSEKAQAKYLDYLSYASEEGALVFMSGWMGVDLSEFALDEPIGNVKSNAIQSAVANFQAANHDGSPAPARSAGSARSSWAPASRSPTSSRSGPPRPTWTGSISPTRSRRAPSKTWSPGWCPSCRSAASTRPNTPRAPCGRSCTAAATACPTSTTARTSASAFPSSDPLPPPAHQDSTGSPA